MKTLRFASLALLAAVLLTSSAGASTLLFTTTLDTDQEVPTPTIPDGFNPSGSGTLTLDMTTMLLTWDIMYQGLTGPIVAPGAHLHGPAGPGSTAGVQVFLAPAGDLPLPASGQLTGSATISMMQANDLIAGLWYANIHTALNQPGEIRGQVNLVPEPGTIGMIAMGGAALGAFLRVRRRRSSVGA